jgi:diadenosine tetraphosphate (Ap4A) HIT family hydrolase
MPTETCVSCRALAGDIMPPGGIIHATPHWIVFLRSRPLLVPGQGFIVLTRHCEDLGQLTDDEAVALGRVLRATARAYLEALVPERVHFGLYGEGVRHIHVHVLPRTRELPAGNIPLTVLGQWYEILHRLGIRRPFTDAVVAQAASQLRAAFERQVLEG